MTARVTIIIPVKDDPDLFDAIASLVERGGAREDDEIVVVDNGSSPAFRASLDTLARVRVVDEPRPGPAAARNTGVAASSGDYIFFLDADGRAEPGWVAAGLEGFAETGADILSGRSRQVAAGPGQRLVRRSTRRARARPTPVEAGYVDTKNLAMRREVLEHVPFPEDLLRGEDVAFGIAAVAAGFRSVRWPAMRALALPDDRIDQLVAKAIVGGWVRAEVHRSGQRRLRDMIGARDQPVRRLLRRAELGILSLFPWATPPAVRLTVWWARALDRHAARLPERLGGVLVDLARWHATTVGIVLYRAGHAQPSVPGILRGEIPPRIRGQVH